VESPITDPPTAEITTELVFNQPPTSGRLIPDSDKLCAPNWPTLYNSASYNGQTGNHTYLEMEELESVEVN